MNKPLITFCVMHVQRLDCTRRCVRAIQETTHVPHQILILIQGYNHTINELSYFIDLAKNDNIRFMYAPTNIGPIAGRGLLISQTDTPLIAMLDNDTYVQKGWLTPILKAFENPHVIAATIPLYNSDGTLIGSGGAHISTKNGLFKSQQVILPSKDYVEVDSVCEGAMVFKREAKPHVVFDPNYQIGYGGIDMNLNLSEIMRKKGLTAIVSVKSKAKHYQNPDSSYKAVRMNYPALAKSYSYFRKKWGLRLSSRKKHLFVKYIYPLLRKPLAQFLRWVRRRPPLIWIWKPKVL